MNWEEIGKFVVGVGVAPALLGYCIHFITKMQSAAIATLGESVKANTEATSALTAEVRQLSSRVHRESR